MTSRRNAGRTLAAVVIASIPLAACSTGGVATTTADEIAAETDEAPTRDAARETRTATPAAEAGTHYVDPNRDFEITIPTTWMESAMSGQGAWLVNGHHDDFRENVVLFSEELPRGTTIEAYLTEGIDGGGILTGIDLGEITTVEVESGQQARRVTYSMTPGADTPQIHFTSYAVADDGVVVLGTFASRRRDDPQLSEIEEVLATIRVTP